MSTRKYLLPMQTPLTSLVFVGVLLFSGHSVVLAQSVPASPSLSWSTEGEETPKLGKVPTSEDIRIFDIDIEPDGTGLPPGSGTPAQGAKTYTEKCQTCHGENGANGPGPRLVGGFGTIGKGDEIKPVKTVGSFWPYATSLYAYIRRAMPYYEPKSLTPDEIYGLSAYIFQLNGLINETDVMNAKTLPKVSMPNRDGFYRWSRGN